MAFTSLNHYMDYNWLLQAYQMTRKDGATGVDGQTAEMYERQLEPNLLNLLDRIKSGRYLAPVVRRTCIEKGNGQKRPLGIPTFEDKIVQRAVVMLLEPIYEQDFYHCSFGFRKHRSAHHALQYLRNHIMDDKGRRVLDVDIQKYFDTIDQGQLRQFLAIRVTDGVVRKLIDKWLKAGILDSGELFYPTQGTPIPDHPEAFVRDMLCQSFYKFLPFTGFVAAGFGAVIQIFIHHGIAVVVFQSGHGQRWSFDIAPQVAFISGGRLSAPVLKRLPEQVNHAVTPRRHDGIFGEVD